MILRRIESSLEFSPRKRSKIKIRIVFELRTIPSGSYIPPKRGREIKNLLVRRKKITVTRTVLERKRTGSALEERRGAEKKKR